MLHAVAAWGAAYATSRCAEPADRASNRDPQIPAQSMDSCAMYGSTDCAERNPWIAQIHRLRPTSALGLAVASASGSRPSRQPEPEPRLAAGFVFTDIRSD